MGDYDQWPLITWKEWQTRLANVTVEPHAVYPRLSGIACPNQYKMRGTKRTCNANLLDLFLVDCGSEKRVQVRCEVCGWRGCRLKGVG